MRSDQGGKLAQYLFEDVEKFNQKVEELRKAGCDVLNNQLIEILGMGEVEIPDSGIENRFEELMKEFKISKENIKEDLAVNRRLDQGLVLGAKRTLPASAMIGVDEHYEQFLKEAPDMKPKVQEKAKEADLQMQRGVRGDGNCFYRAWSYASIESALLDNNNEYFNKILEQYKEAYNNKEKFENDNAQRLDSIQPQDMMTLEEFKRTIEGIRDHEPPGERLLKFFTESTVGDNAKRFDASLVGCCRYNLVRVLEAVKGQEANINLEQGFSIETALTGGKNIAQQVEVVLKFGEDFEGEVGMRLLEYVDNVKVNKFVLSDSKESRSAHYIPSSEEGISGDIGALENVRGKDDNPPTITLENTKGHYNIIYDKHFCDEAQKKQMLLPTLENIGKFQQETQKQQDFEFALNLQKEEDMQGIPEKDKTKVDAFYNLGNVYRELNKEGGIKEDISDLSKVVKDLKKYYNDNIKDNSQFAHLSDRIGILATDLKEQVDKISIISGSEVEKDQKGKQIEEFSQDIDKLKAEGTGKWQEFFKNQQQQQKRVDNVSIT